MSEDVSELLAELSAEVAPARAQRAEHERRRQIVLAMNERLAALDAKKKGAPARTRTSRWWLLLPAAAGLALVLGAVQRSSRPPNVSLEPEQLQAKVSRAPGPPHNQTEAVQPRPPELPSMASVRRSLPSSLKPAPVAPSAPAAAPPLASVAPPPPAVEPSLAAQNELFQSAVRASRRGDDATALSELDALLARYPGSVLAADARVRKFRTLARLGRSGEARVAAQDYLRHHPAGFAAAEARKLIEAESPSP